mmetsp:Transcript_11495/g.31787  ORF Transcript_11495/g.31787 Transcript_11495/m.31787 type:complete len:152 (-) Transcript_11495:115-570(-)
MPPVTSHATSSSRETYFEGHRSGDQGFPNQPTSIRSIREMTVNLGNKMDPSSMNSSWCAVLPRGMRIPNLVRRGSNGRVAAATIHARCMQRGCGMEGESVAPCSSWFATRTNATASFRGQNQTCTNATMELTILQPQSAVNKRGIEWNTTQ